jgi:predicted transcriptional regulator of viral defense system
LASLAKACAGDQVAIAAQLEELAYDHGIGITVHRIAIQRALAAVQAINDTIDRMQHNGGMKELNRAFKAARKVDPSLRYYDYLHAKKASMLEAMATQR